MNRKYDIWRRDLIRYFSNNKDNIYGDAITGEDKVIVFRSDTGANQYDRLTTISELVAAASGSASNLAYITNSTVGFITNSNGTGFTIPAASASIAGLLTGSNNTALLANTAFRTTPSSIILAGTNLSWSGNTLNATGGSGSGDMVGPAGATDENIVIFDGITGKLTKDGGATIAAIQNITTNLSEGTNTTTTVDINSSDGTNATILAASTLRAGVMTKSNFDSLALNITHRTSDGSDHSFINQDVTTTSSPTLITPNINSLQVNLSAAVSVATGEMAWNADEGTFDFGLLNNVVWQGGQEQPFLVKNQTGSDIPNGTPVMFAGGTGASGRVKVMLAIADGTYLPGYTLGLTTQTIVNGDDGYIVPFGKVRGIQTDGVNYGEVWADNDIIYISASTGGYLTNVAPAAPNLRITAGIVLYAHASNGTLISRPTWRGSLAELDDVNGTALTVDGQLPIWDNVNSYFDFTKNINDYTLAADLAAFSGATLVGMGILGAPTYTKLQDWSNSVQSAGVINGGIITDAGSGTIDISTVNGIIKSVNTAIGDNLFFDLTGVSGQSLTDGSTNYIAIDYNSGTPQFIIGTTSTANGHTIFNLGKVYREGTSLDIIDSGLNIYDFTKRIQQHHVEEAALHFVSGAKVSETGTLNIAITEGIMYAGFNRIVTDAIDTSVANDFEYYYYNGSNWIESDETQISNLQYNNIATGLVDLSSQQYGVHWVYKGTNSSTYVVYGQESYTLTNAQAAQPPSSLPEHVSGFGVPRAKIIIKKSETSFTEIESFDDVTFTASTASNHNELAALQGGTATEYYHLTSAEYTGSGTGIFARITSPSFITPNIGTPSAGTLTNCTFPTLNQNTTGSAASLSTTLDIATGGTGQITAQLAINALSDVAGGTNEYVLTKDTSTGNALWKVAAGGGNTEDGTVSGQMLFWDGTSEYKHTEIAELMWDDSNMRFGVNTAIPLYPFHTTGISRMAGDVYIMDGSGAKLIIYSSSIVPTNIERSELYQTGANFYIANKRSNGNTYITGAASGNIVYINDQYRNVGIGRAHTADATVKLTLAGAMTIHELSSDPADPIEGSYVTWMSNGTGTGDDGDIIVKITAGSVTKTTTLIDFSTL